jgi:hypothetical protein
LSGSTPFSAFTHFWFLLSQTSPLLQVVVFELSLPPPSARAGPTALKQSPNAAARITSILMISSWLVHRSERFAPGILRRVRRRINDCSRRAFIPHAEGGDEVIEDSRQAAGVTIFFRAGPTGRRPTIRTQDRR